MSLQHRIESKKSEHGCLIIYAGCPPFFPFALGELSPHKFLFCCIECEDGDSENEGPTCDVR